MNDARPLISICIPTYNRAPFLEATLRSIVEQEVFQQTRDVEIVISDNCSTDHTPQVIAAFTKRFPDNIRAARQERLVDANVNFACVLEAGQGLLRKLHNDTLTVNGDFLGLFVEVVKNARKDKPLLFFLNGNNLVPCAETATLCRTLDAFVSHVSFYSTWIGGFSLWDTDVPQYAPLFHEARHQFVQTEILFAALTGGREALVYTPKFGEAAMPPKTWTKKDLEDVYFAEYLAVVQRYALDGHIGQETEKREIRRFCMSFYIPYYHTLANGRFVKTFYRDFSFLKQYTYPFLYIVMHAYYMAYFLCYRFIKDARYADVVRKMKTRLYR